MTKSVNRAGSSAEFIGSDESNIYKSRFENLHRVAMKVTSCLNIGDVLEIIRDEVKITVPHAREACLILLDPEAPNYTRPLHCAVQKEQINCHMCKKGKNIIRHAAGEPKAMYCSIPTGHGGSYICNAEEHEISEIAMPIYDGREPLAVLNVVTEKGTTLQEKDIQLLTDLAELAANSITNAKKYSKMASEKLSVERILGHIESFVPQTVKRIIEKNPDAPALNRQELDVSILFLDVADYTRISENLTLEKVNFIIEKYFSGFLDIIYYNSGDVNETAGDGLMAIFQGTENENAMNAATAALQIRKRTEEINLELSGMFYPIIVNMGINSGIASVGTSRFKGASGIRTTFTASGSATNLASRLASAAFNGDILIGPVTASRVQSRMTLFDRGHMAFKNFRKKVHAFSLVKPPE